VPARTTAGWFYGTDRCDKDGAFIPQDVDTVRYL